MPDDVLALEDVVACNLLGGCEGVWECANEPPWRLTWTEKACVPVAMGLAECLADFAEPYETT